MKHFKIILFCALLIFTFSCQNEAPSESSNTVKVTRSQIKTVDTAGYDQIKADSKGKVLMINFFASWCDACKQETPGFVRAYADLKDSGLEIIGLSVDRSVAEAAEFMNTFNVNYPVYYADESIRKKFNITYLPTNIIYSPKGALLDVHVGFISEEDLHTLVKKYAVTSK